jgi:hypothetical protein
MRKIIYAILLIPAILFSQDDLPPPGLEDPPGAPIDQIKHILLATAIILGLYFIYKKHKTPQAFAVRKNIKEKSIGKIN